MNLNILWILFEDLNEIMDSSEKFGGHQGWKMNFFLKQFIHDMVEIDLGIVRGRFT